ncbi:MAG: transglutaminase-like cysteine peptidase [Kiloniellales bacterium]
MTLRIWPALLAAAFTALLSVSDSAPASARSYPSLFDSGEQRGNGLAAFPKWVGALERSVNDRQVPERCTPGSRYDVCHIEAWDAFIESLRGKDRLTQIAAVNQEMNRRRYIIDPVNWGLDDYWTSPLQFFRKQGDCEDYAIAKFLTLRALGFTNEDLRIVVLMDTNLKLAHAVLVVYLDDRAYVLDNQISSVVRAETIRHYRPIYSINETSWWLHKPRS